MNDYQAAAAANDTAAARKALLALVTAKDDVSDYWAELGKLEIGAGRFGEANYAFTRAYELDRRNPDLVRAVTQLALKGGDLALAQRHASELEVIAPDDPWVKLTRGWAAIAQSQFDQALAASDALLATMPFDPSATVLKSRALIGLGRGKDATDLLEKQIAAQPSDTGSMRMLERVYERSEDWPNLAKTAQSLSSVVPDDPDNLLILVKAALRSGNVPLARQASSRLLKPDSLPVLIASVLDVWALDWHSPQRLDDARQLAARSGPVQQMIYARYLSAWGSPQDALRLAAPLASLPITAANAEANAVAADAWGRSGQIAQARQRFDAVLTFDSGNATALKGRADLFLRTGNAAAAVRDAQKLVTVVPTDAEARLLLARSFLAADNKPWADRTLWSAFQDIPANQMIFGALLATRKGDADATRELQEEFARQRDANLSRGLA
jgi:predicted Zn-dependent protease